MPASATRNQRLHATTIAVGGAAMAITGAAGAGKSGLALNCLASPAGPLCTTSPMLVADDQTLVTEEAGRLLAYPCEILAGLIEMRGLGLVRIAHVAGVPLVCVLNLTDGFVPRLPETSDAATILGHDLPRLQLARTDPALVPKALSWLAVSAGHLERLADDRLLTPR